MDGPADTNSPDASTLPSADSNLNQAFKEFRLMLIIVRAR